MGNVTDTEARVICTQYARSFQDKPVITWLDSTVKVRRRIRFKMFGSRDRARNLSILVDQER